MIAETPLLDEFLGKLTAYSNCLKLKASDQKEHKCF